MKSALGDSKSRVRGTDLLNQPPSNAVLSYFWSRKDPELVVADLRFSAKHVHSIVKSGTASDISNCSGEEHFLQGTIKKVRNADESYGIREERLTRIVLVNGFLQIRFVLGDLVRNLLMVNHRLLVVDYTQNQT